MKKRLGLGLLVVAPAFAALVVAHAYGALPVRPAKFTWDKNGVLRGTFSFKDALEAAPVAKKLSNGLKVTVVMRGYIYANSGGDPVGLTAHSCNIAYDLWNEIYYVSVNGKKSVPIVTRKGVYRKCTDLEDHPIADRLVTLKNKPADYYLAVKVEVDPISDDITKKIQQWVTRPSGASGGIGPGDALFASFVGVFMKKVATAGYVIEFQTGPFPP
ncbi:MAG: hypothetical protein ABI175_17570 [Polyangiales bacterium]